MSKTRHIINLISILFAICKLSLSEYVGLDCLENYSVFYGVTLAAEKILKESDCRNDLANITQSILSRETWALKLYDASGTPSTGLHWGNTYWLGSRTQCLAASRTDYGNLNPNPSSIATAPTAIPPFPVDYFVAYLRHNSDFQISVYWENETKISLGLCLPSSCSELQISTCLQSFLDSERFSYQHLYNTSLHVLEVKKTEEKFHIDDPVTIALIIILSTITFLTLSATVYDLKTSQSSKHLCDRQNDHPNEDDISDNLWIKLLTTFSFTRNFQSIFKMTTGSAKFDSICGLRVFTTAWVIISHSVLFLLDFYKNRVFAFDLVGTYSYQLFLNSSFLTDAFFCMSGFLMAYSFFNSKSDIEKGACSLGTSYLKSIFKRVARLSPAYLVIMLTTIVLASWNHSEDSLWINERNDIVCRQYWWTNMLYINNIYPGRNMCMYWTHYLALDMQFFIIVTFCFHLSKKFFKLAATILLSMLFGSVICLGYTTYAMDYKPFSVHFYRYIEIFYYPPWMRIGSYIIGTIYGYLYLRMDKRLELKKIWISLIWVIVISAMLLLEFAFKDRNMSLNWSIFHTCFSRNIWAACIGWIILACLTGNGGLLNDLLSAKIWIPFSRLTYCAYLINPIISYTIAARSEKSLTYETFNTGITASGLIVITILFSVPLACCVEIPCIEIYNIITNLFSKERKINNNTEVVGSLIDKASDCKKEDDGFESRSRLNLLHNTNFSSFL